MYDHSGRLIDDGQIFVFKNDIERDVFGFKSSGRFFRKVNVYLVALAELVCGLCFLSVYQDIAVLYQPTQPRPRPAFDLLGEKGVQPLSGISCLRMTYEETILSFVHFSLLTETCTTVLWIGKTRFDHKYKISDPSKQGLVFEATF